MLKELKALKLDSAVDLSSSQTTESTSDSEPSNQLASSSADSTEGAPFATPAFVKENLKSNIMKKSIDDLLHD